MQGSVFATELVVIGVIILELMESLESDSIYKTIMVIQTSVSIIGKNLKCRSCYPYESAMSVRVVLRSFRLSHSYVPA